jgi:hypothetical protein
MWSTWWARYPAQGGLMTLSEAQSYWKLSDQQIDRVWQLLTGREQGMVDGHIAYLVDDVEWAVQQVWKGRRR